MRSFEQQHESKFESVVKQAKFGASISGSTMFIHEIAPGLFISTENPYMQGEPAKYTVDPRGEVHEYQPDVETIEKFLDLQRDMGRVIVSSHATV